VTYINKSDRGVSKLLREAMEETRGADVSIPQKLAFVSFNMTFDPPDFISEDDVRIVPEYVIRPPAQLLKSCISCKYLILSVLPPTSGMNI